MIDQFADFVIYIKSNLQTTLHLGDSSIMRAIIMCVLASVTKFMEGF
jgi:hypothetical protein